MRRGLYVGGLVGWVEGAVTRRLGVGVVSCQLVLSMATLGVRRRHAAGRVNRLCVLWFSVRYVEGQVGGCGVGWVGWLHALRIPLAGVAYRLGQGLRTGSGCGWQSCKRLLQLSAQSSVMCS